MGQGELNVKRIVFFVIVLLSLPILVSCATVVSGDSADEEKTDEELIRELFDDYASYRGSVAIGISGRHSDKANAVREATENCLQMLAFYRGLAFQADYDSRERTSSLGSYFSSRSVGGTVDSIYESASSDMQIVEVKWYGGAVGAAVFARLPEMKEITAWEDGDWLEELPELDSLNAAAATSNRFYFFTDNAMEAAAFRTAQALLDEDDSTLTSSVTVVETDTHSYRSDSYSISGNRLRGFRILDYEYDGSNGRVWALGVSEK